jgi:hypothetical protein
MSIALVSGLALIGLVVGLLIYGVITTEAKTKPNNRER